jgi:hypothetical protein
MNMKTEKKRILAVDDQASSTRLAKLYQRLRGQGGK